MAIKKITLPDNTTQDIQDARISGVDTTPTSGSNSLVTSGGIYTSLSSKANDSDVVHKSGNEAINGAKTFSGLTTASNLDVSGDVDIIGGTIYNEGVEGFSWIQDSEGNSIQDALDAKATDSAVVHKTGNETIVGNKTFTGSTQVEDVFNDTISGFAWITDCDGESVQDYFDDKEDTSNKVTSLSSSSTNAQYPSAKCVWDIIGDIETLINAL